MLLMGPLSDAISLQLRLFWVNVTGLWDMNKKIRLDEIKVEWLNKRALVLISIFATAAYKQERVVIDLRASDVLEQVSSIVKSSNNAELNSLYQRIKREVRLSLQNVKFEDEVQQARATVEAKAKKEAEAKSSLRDSLYFDRAGPQ